MWKGVARCRRLVVSDRVVRESQIVHRLQRHDIRRGEENAKYSTAEKASEYRGNLINIERRISPYRKVNEETEFKKLWQLQNLAILKNFNLKVPKDQQKVVRVAVIGRANSGKSTLINRLIGRNACPVANQNDSTYRTSIHSVQKGNIIYEFVDLPGVPDVISPTGVGEYTFRRRNKEAAAQNESGNRSLFQRDNANFATNDIFVKNCDVILVCADLTSRMTLAGNLTVMVYKLLKRNPHIPAMLVLTKSDRLKYRTNYKFRNMERKNARLLKLVDIVDKVTEGHLNGQLTESGRHKFFNKPENIIQMKPATVEVEESGLEQRRPMRFRRMSQVRQVESILRLANSWRWDDLNLHEKRLYQLGNRGWRYFESVFPVTMEMPQTTDVIFEQLAEKALPREWDVDEILDGQLDPFELIEENVSMACLGMTKQGKHKFAAVTDINHLEVNGSPADAEIRLDLDLSLKTDAERLHLKKNLRSTGKDMIYMEKTYSKYMIRIRNTLENKLKAAFDVKNVEVNLNFLTKELKNEPIVNIAPKMEKLHEEIPNYSDRVAPSPQPSFDTFFADRDDFHFMTDNVKRSYLKGLSTQQKKVAGIFEAEEMEKAKKKSEKHSRRYGRDDTHGRFDNRPKIFFE